jgi:hypothetical protein
MNIYLYAPRSNDYDNLVLASRRDHEGLMKLLGQPMCQKWRAVKVRLRKEDHRADFPSFLPHIPAFSQHALDVLQPHLGNAIEALPLACGRERFYAINVVDVTDCLDERRSKIDRDPSGKVMFIDKHIFDEKCVGERLMFRIRQAPLWGVYFTDRFKRLLEMAKLEGLKDRKVFP